MVSVIGKHAMPSNIKDTRVWSSRCEMAQHACGVRRAATAGGGGGGRFRCGVADLREQRAAAWALPLARAMSPVGGFGDGLGEQE